MNAVSGMDQPPQGTVASNNASRRTFLKGVGLAGAAGLAAPLLASTGARAAAEGLILGVNAPAPFNNTPTWPNAVKGAVGCRSYRDHVLKTADDVKNLGGFPGEPGSKVVASIRPDPRVLLDPNNPEQPAFDNAIKALIANGRDNPQLPAPQLTVWHEAGNLYTNCNTPENWCQYNLTAQTVRSMHVKMQNLCNEVGGVGYGCIIYGEISKMASDTDPTHNYVPNPGYPLDWYGIDVYYEDDPGWGRGDLVDYTAVKNYMDRWLAVAKERSGLAYPKINVCECNANATNDAKRPQFFKNLALWLHNNGGRRMLTFFPDGGGPHSVPWPPPQATIDALNYIQATYG